MFCELFLIVTAGIVEPEIIGVLLAMLMVLPVAFMFCEAPMSTAETGRVLYQ